MPIVDSGYELSSSDYIRDTETILKRLTLSGDKIVKARLHGKVVYIVTDMALAKTIYEDGRNFSFAPVEASGDHALTEGAKAFVGEGLGSQLLATAYDEYKESRKLFNLAFKHSYVDRAEAFGVAAGKHLAAQLDAISGRTVDMRALCQRYWMPLAADVIGVGSLSFADQLLLADCSRVLVEGNGLQGDRESIAALAQANDMVFSLIAGVVEAGGAPAHSALGFFLTQVDECTAVDFTRTFVLGGIDTGSSALVLQANRLAAFPDQLVRFLALDEAEQYEAITELVAKDAPAYYSPRFAVRDIEIAGEVIPAGSFVQLALYGMNSCANPDFDVGRHARSACPAHNNDTLPFGHARHKCPGEPLARHLSAIFLNGFFRRFRLAGVRAASWEYKTFARQINELIFELEH